MSNDRHDKSAQSIMAWETPHEMPETLDPNTIRIVAQSKNNINDGKHWKHTWFH